MKEIGLWAFSGCTSLSNVNLGNVERICDQSFKNCTALTSIKLPKTLSKDASGAPFSGCTNLKNIELEEGMTVVPNYVCAGTPITEITIPNTVKEIGLWAFKDCTSLKKITILDNVTDMGGYNSSNTDLVFQNHNDDLTIYCYEDSLAAQYAIKYNIKYVYLQRQESQTPGENNNNNSENSNKENQESEGKQEETGKKDPDEDNTQAKDGKLPYTGKGITIVMIMLGLTIVATVAYSKVRYLKEI